MPIYSEARTLASFLAPGRIRRLIGSHFRESEFDPLAGLTSPSKRTFSLAPKTYAWKADFNQCTSGQLKRALKRAEQLCAGRKWGAFVLIGHSKLYDRMNQRGLRRFLEFCASHPIRFQPGTAASSLGFLAELDKEAPQATAERAPAQALTTSAQQRP
jgi:hypothetical protein